MCRFRFSFIAISLHFFSEFWYVCVFEKKKIYFFIFVSFSTSLFVFRSVPSSKIILFLFLSFLTLLFIFILPPTIFFFPSFVHSKRLFVMCVISQERKNPSKNNNNKKKKTATVKENYYFLFLFLHFYSFNMVHS